MIKKLTKKVRKDLADLAKMLPEAPSGQKRRMIARGGSILAADPDRKNKDGGDLKLDSFYTGDQEMIINHKKKLEQAYLQGGTEAINAYIRIYFPDYGQEEKGAEA